MCIVAPALEWLFHTLRALLQINITITAQNDSTSAISQLVQQALASGQVQSALQASGELSSLTCLPVLSICQLCCPPDLPPCVQHLLALLFPWHLLASLFPWHLLASLLPWHLLALLLSQARQHQRAPLKASASGCKHVGRCLAPSVALE